MADPEERTIRRDGYEITFYPGFASRCAVTAAGQPEVELYRQAKGDPYRLPPGQTRPRDRYRVHLKGGAKKQDVEFAVRDPGLRIKRITVELYGDDHLAGSGADSDTVDTLMLENNADTCPPSC